MPFALVLIGLAMIITGAKDTHLELGDQLVKDFTGDKNFTVWIAALGGIGAVGYIKDLQPISRAFMVLIIVLMVVRNGGLFAKFGDALSQGPESIPRPAATPNSGGAATGRMSNDPSNPQSWWDHLFGPDLNRFAPIWDFMKANPTPLAGPVNSAKDNFRAVIDAVKSFWLP